MEFDWTQGALAEGLRHYNAGEYFTRMKRGKPYDLPGDYTVAQPILLGYRIPVRKPPRPANLPGNRYRNTARETLLTGAESGVYEDLRDVEADLRNPYRLIGRPG
jgi:hypothetical protein